MAPHDHTLRTILDAMPLMFFLKDTENRIVLTNKAVADTLGVRPEDLQGTYTSQWYPDEAEAYHQDDIEVMQSKTPKLGIIEPFQVSESEKHWISTDKYPYYDSNGDVVGVLVFIRDATQQAMAEAALRGSEERLQHANDELTRVMESISDGLWSIELDSNHNIISQYCSPVMEEITGRSPEFFDRGPGHWLAAVHSEDRDRVERASLSLLSGEERKLVEAYRIRMPDESIRWLRDSAATRTTPEGHIRIDRVVTNITEQRAAEEDRQGFEERARHVQRLESLGILAGGVAHDFNNILTGIFGNCELATYALGPDSPALGHVEQIRESARRAAGLCNQMLAYSGKGRFSLRALDLSEVALSVSHLLKTSISRQATLELQLQSDLPAVEAEPPQIQQVVMNLLMNASDAIGDEGGVITTRTGEMYCDREYLSNTFVDDGLREGAYVFIEVSDTGEGMTAEVRHKVFDPFFTTKFAGRGLGLAAVLGIVRGHRGAVEIHSEVGAGTVFRVLFPASDLAVMNSPPQQPEPADSTGHGLVLIVDDERVVREYARESLERSGFEVLIAPDGPEALEMFRERGDEITAVLLDLTMPKMNGHDVLKELRRMRADVRVLLSSGYDEREVMEGVTTGSTGFIQKPYGSEELVRTLNDVIDSGP
jgi:PAS domain S-box-containing protein